MTDEAGKRGGNALAYAGKATRAKVGFGGAENGRKGGDGRWPSKA